MRLPHALAWAALAVLSGCASLRHDQVSFGNLADCPAQTAQTLVNAQDQFGHATDTRILACALTFVRGSKDVDLRRTALGSHLCLHLAERESNKARQEKLAAEGVALAEAAIQLGGGQNGATHYYLATNLGLAVHDHITLALENLGRLETELKQAMAMNPAIDDGGPLRVLGALYLKAPAWPNGIGDPAKALELLAQAVEQHPAHPLNHLFYAQALWQDDSEGNADKARAEFAEGLKRLHDGNWGHNRTAWQKEFDEFEQDMAQAGAITTSPGNAA